MSIHKHSFWDNFTFGFVNGMFGGNPFFSPCFGFNNPWGGSFPCFNSFFPMSNVSLFTVPNVTSGAYFTPLLPEVNVPSFDNIKFDINELFPVKNWTPTTDTYNNYSFMTDTFTKSYSPMFSSYSPSSVSTASTTTSATSSSTSTSTSTSTSSTSSSNKSKKSSSALKSKHWTKMTDAEMKAVYGNYTRDITTRYNGTAQDLNRYLKGKGVLEGKGQAFIDAQNKYGISASVLVAIAVHESGGGKSNLARKNNNIAGVRVSGSTKFKKYASVAECIDDVARFLKSGYVNNSSKSLTKLYQVNAKYCPTADTTDTGGINACWARNVDKITSDVEKVSA